MLEKLRAATIVCLSFSLSLNSPAQCPFLFVITMSAKSYFEKEKSRVSRTFLAVVSASISDVPGQKVWGMCVMGPRCYCKEFCLSLQGESRLDGQLQL